MKNLFILGSLVLCLAGCTKQEAEPRQSPLISRASTNIGVTKSVSSILDEQKYNVDKIKRSGLDIDQLEDRQNKHLQVASRNGLRLPPTKAELQNNIVTRERLGNSSETKKDQVKEIKLKPVQMPNFPPPPSFP